MFALTPDEHREERLLERFLMHRVRNDVNSQEVQLSWNKEESPKAFSSLLGQIFYERGLGKQSPPLS